MTHHHLRRRVTVGPVEPVAVDLVEDPDLRGPDPPGLDLQIADQSPRLGHLPRVELDLQQLIDTRGKEADRLRLPGVENHLHAPDLTEGV